MGTRDWLEMPAITPASRSSRRSLDVPQVRLGDAQPSITSGRSAIPADERKSRTCHAHSVVTINVRTNGDSECRVRLTSAEARVLPFLPTQLTIGEIAARVDRGRSTVKTHVAHIYAKLGASKRTEAVERARELGLLRDPEGSALLGHPGPEGPARVGRVRSDRTVGNRQ